jgi:hypothetical protein
MPSRGAKPMSTSATSFTRTGVPFCSATTTFSMSWTGRVVRAEQADAADVVALLAHEEALAADVLIGVLDRGLSWSRGTP